jgi:transposase
MAGVQARDEMLYLRAAGVDVGKRFVVACVRTPDPRRAGRWLLETERFDTTAAAVRGLRDWLTARAVEVIALEATSDYWRAVYYPLQDAGLNLMLVNPSHLRGIKGRKTDPSDAAFLARAAASGMVLASFVPDRAIRELRELTRRRTEIRADRGREIQRLEKELEDSGVKLSSVLSDVTGVSARRILASLIEGERDPARLAELTVSGARAKIPALIEALQGTFTDHHAFMCRHFLHQIDHLAGLVVELDTRIAALPADRDQDLTNLDTIPGIGRTAAEIVISETGGDMAPFATAGHLASWIGVCPGVNESAGVNRSGHTRHGRRRPQTHPGHCCDGRDQTEGLLLCGVLPRCTTGVSPPAAVGSGPWSRSCTNWSSRSGTFCMTRSRTTIWVPTTSIAATRTAPCARSSGRPTPSV